MNYNQNFQETYNQIQDTGNRLLKYLIELRRARLKEGDATHGLQSIEDDITKSWKALKEQKYQVAVIAAMKAGKSTFLNALIGADVLASESEACTVCRTDISPINVGQTPRLLEYQEGKQKPVLLVEGKAQEIRKTFLNRTHEIRKTNNVDGTTHFKLEHPIEAISQMPSLAGFKLVDTPGPNEWESASFNTVALKQTALEALRTSDAILFILDYTSFKDNTNYELLQDLIEKRSDFLTQNRGKIYFVLNKIDRKSEKDREIDEVIKDLKKTLMGFGIPKPIVYPVSAWKGLLAKLLKNQTATPEDKADFKNFFIAKYMEEDEDGEIIVPKMKKIAPKALQDSGITTIENAVIQTVVKNSGWNLLSDVLASFNKAAQSIELALNTDIQGWKLGFENLQQKIEEYKKNSDSARQKVAIIKKSVEEQKQILIIKFSQGVKQFAKKAKKELAIEINKVAKESKKNSPKQKEKTLWSILIETVELFSNNSESDPYKIRVKDKKKAEKVGQLINQYCTPIIHDFWLDTQDSLVREGTKIREDLVTKIQREIQAISDELSKYIGQSLELDINTNPIHFPKFEFSGIDARIKQQQEVFTKTKKETKKKSRCCKSDKVYEVDVEYQETVSYYEIDLQLTLQGIYKRIDEQVEINKGLLERVIQKQVAEDFWKAEKQINEYINRFQFQFDQLLKERATREIEAPEIIANLENEITKVSKYKHELISVQRTLDTWKPNTNFSSTM